MPRTFPNGSTTEAVTNPASPRRVSGSYSLSPMDTNRSRVAATSSTCQYKMAPPGPGAQELGVPSLRRLEIVRPVVDGSESPQHPCSSRLRWPSIVWQGWTEKIPRSAERRVEILAAQSSLVLIVGTLLDQTFPNASSTGTLGE